MATKLTVNAIEESSYIVTAAFTDEDGDAVTPESITWTLTDKDGTIINSREDVSISIPASSINVVLSGDDLAIAEVGAKVKRIVTIEATYNSSYGTGLYLKKSAEFTLENLIAVS